MLFNGKLAFFQFTMLFNGNLRLVKLLGGDIRMYTFFVQTYGNSTLCLTGHRPFGDAALKGGKREKKKKKKMEKKKKNLLKNCKCFHLAGICAKIGGSTFFDCIGAWNSSTGPR